MAAVQSVRLYSCYSLTCTSVCGLDVITCISIVSATDQSKHIHVRADASVGIAYASLHGGPAVQNLKPHANALSH